MDGWMNDGMNEGMNDGSCERINVGNARRPLLLFFSSLNYPFHSFLTGSSEKRKRREEKREK